MGPVIWLFLRHRIKWRQWTNSHNFSQMLPFTHQANGSIMNWTKMASILNRRSIRNLTMSTTTTTLTTPPRHSTKTTSTSTLRTVCRTTSTQTIAAIGMVLIQVTISTHTITTRIGKWIKVSSPTVSTIRIFVGWTAVKIVRGIWTRWKILGRLGLTVRSMTSPMPTQGSKSRLWSQELLWPLKVIFSRNSKLRCVETGS